ncbi:hypothetical protein [Streptomyces filamentosus]|uniref:hypothetical protein n=1 Tax=Streptomyces filamentosus TaxID=67294 RepID=UPI0033F7A577
MPEPLRRAVHQLVCEAVTNCQEVLRYTEPDIARDWKRMTMTRATDASGTMDMTAMLIAAYCQHISMASHTLQNYLQVGQQEIRAHGPHEEDRAHVAGLMGEALSYEALRTPVNRTRHHPGQRQAEQAQRREED